MLISLYGDAYFLAFKLYALFLLSNDLFQSRLSVAGLIFVCLANINGRRTEIAFPAIRSYRLLMISRMALVTSDAFFLAPSGSGDVVKMH